MNALAVSVSTIDVTAERGVDEDTALVSDPRETRGVPAMEAVPASPPEPITPTAVSLHSPHDEPEPQPTRPSVPTSVFSLLQQWEGVVSATQKDHEFVAVLQDLTAPSRPEEQATFSVDQVSPADRASIVPGGVFYWSIGYEDTPGGTRKTTSIIRFRRLPAWSRRDMDRIDRRVRRFQYLFEGDG